MGSPSTGQTKEEAQAIRMKFPTKIPVSNPENVICNICNKNKLHIDHSPLPKDHNRPVLQRVRPAAPAKAQVSRATGADHVRPDWRH